MDSHQQELEEKLKSSKGIDRAKILNDLAYFLRNTNPDKAIELAAEATTISKTFSYKEGIGRAHLTMGWSQFLKNNNAKSLEESNSALKIFRELKDNENLAYVYNNMGNIYNSMGDFEKALEFYNKGLSLHRNTSNSRGESHTLNNIGLVYYRKGDYSNALKHHLFSLAIKQQLNDKSGEATSLIQIGDVYHRIGDHANALENLLKAMMIKRQTFDRYGEGSALNSIGNVYCDLEDFDKALEYYKKAYVLFKDLNDRSGEALTLGNLGNIYLYTNVLKNAIKYYRNSLKILLELNDKENISNTYVNIGNTYTRMVKFKDAAEYYKKGLELSTTIGAKRLQALSLLGLGQTYIQLKDKKNAEDSLNEALKITKVTGSKEINFRVLKELSDIHEKTGDFKKALEYIKEHHAKQKEIFNEESDRKVKNLQVMHQVENAKIEAEIYRLKNVELAKALDEVEVLNKDLKKLNDEKNDLLGIVAHDLRNPISSLIMLGDAIKDTLVSEELSRQEIIEYATDIEITSKRTLDILSNLLDVNSYESGKFKINPRKIVINSIIKKIVEAQSDYAASKKIELITAFSNKSYYIIADESAAEQVITNVINNAIKYSPSNKKVTINLTKKKNKVFCSVKDNGPGILVKDREKLFTKFAKLNNKPTGGEIATGLGLYIVKNLMEKMKGEVTCVSSPGKGSEFVLEFPAESSKS
jgi:signal transduction histidine kinase/Tfp pilus assembly protein PilF